MKLYLLTYDASHPLLDSETLHSFIVKSSHIKGWAQYYPGCYMLVSETPVHELSAQLGDVLGSGRSGGPGFILTKMESYTTNGRLPKEAWDWLFRHQPPSGGLAGIREQQIANS